MGAVLVAISIPIFSSQLEKSREAVDLANIRAAYAECMTAHLTDDDTAYYKEVEAKQNTAGWTIDASDVAGLNVGNDNVGKTMKVGTNIFVCVTADGTFSLAASAPQNSTALN